MNYSIIKKSELEGAQRIDAEYFQPEYTELEQLLIETNSYKRWGDLDGNFITGPFGSEFNVENYIENGKYRYIRGKDVKEFFLTDDDNEYIPEEDFKRLNKYSLKEGDILISVVGTSGNSAIVDAKALPAIFSSKSSVFRASNIDPYYLITYLNSKYGKGLLLRNVRGQVQTGLNIEDLRKLLLFIPSDKEQQFIDSLVTESFSNSQESVEYYQQAEDLLLEELGLKDFVVEEDLSFVVNLSDVEEANRIDAEYFQPKYENLISRIKEKNAKLLDDLVSMKKGFEPGSEEYQEEGKLFIRVSSLSKFGIEDKDQKYLNEDLYKKLRGYYEPKLGEILLTKDAAPGIAYVLREPVAGIISGGILRLKVKDGADPEYLSLCISSLIGQMQAERDAGGSIIAHWKPEQIKSLLIPILPKPTQQKIADLVRESHEARKKSMELLEEAKGKVEEMIEKGMIN